MIWLLLAIAASTVFALGLAFGKRIHLDDQYVTCTNYGVAALTAAALACRQWPSGGSGWGTAVLLGVGTGVFFVAGLWVMQPCITTVGAGVTTMYQRLGTLIPTLFAVAFWQERPSMISWCGILLACASLVLQSGEKLRFHRLLPFVFLVNGTGQMFNKLYARYGTTDWKPLYMATLFSTAFLLALIPALLRKNRPHFSAVTLLVGSAIGLSNLGTAFFIVSALNDLPTSLVYPMYSGGVILLTQLCSAALFGDHPGKRGWVALGGTLLGLVLMNL